MVLKQTDEMQVKIAVRSAKVAAGRGSDVVPGSLVS
jgi:hypothetical protein